MVEKNENMINISVKLKPFGQYNIEFKGDTNDEVKKQPKQLPTYHTQRQTDPQNCKINLYPSDQLVNVYSE